MIPWENQKGMNQPIQLMYAYAEQVRHDKQSLTAFGADWKTLIQPVIDTGAVHSNESRNWAAFSLLVYYLESEGIKLPLCSKLWIAAIRLFLAIAETKCPPDLLAKEPPFWSNLIGVDFPPNLSHYSASDISEVIADLSECIEKIDGISLRGIRKMISEGISPDFPHECGFVRLLCDAIVRWKTEADEGDTGDLQSNLMKALRESGKYREEDLTKSLRDAQNSSYVTQLDLQVASLTSTRGRRGYTLSIEECSALVTRPRERGRFPDLDPFGDEFMDRSVFYYGRAFPGRLPQAAWNLRKPGAIKPPDPLKLWIARNWVNPVCPVWLMTVPAVEVIVEAIGLIDRSGTQRSTIRQASRTMTSLQRSGERGKDLPIKDVSLSSEMSRLVSMSGGDPDFGRVHPGFVTVGRDIFPFLSKLGGGPWPPSFEIRTE